MGGIRAQATEEKEEAMKPSTVGTGRADAVYLGDQRIQFTHRRCGHVWVVDYAKKSVTKRLPPAGCRMMASWWSAEKGGCISACPKCERVARTEKTDCGKGLGTYSCKRPRGRRGPCGNRDVKTI